MMDVGIIGLGLIGSSIARAVKKHTDLRVAGYDLSHSVMRSALLDGAVDAAGMDEACACDLVFVCLFPSDAVEFILNHKFSHIVCDVCGVKGAVAKELSGKVPGYVGVHPMAGKEISGYQAGDADLFRKASLIITQDENTDPENIRAVEDFARKIGFSRVVVTTHELHDKVIAYTSQLAHVVSSAYVKSGTAMEYVGYSAGSFADMTRVARLDPKMWTELFFMNKEHLTAEIDSLIGHLTEYKKALQEDDGEAMARLLQEGRERKESLDRMNEK
jgi:prephenate dehydrogenase